MFRLILVEDEPRILRHLKEKIRTLRPDFKIVGAYNNGEDALVELHWTQPHAIITDIRMPVMNGLELIGKVRALLPGIQCAILSGYDDYSYLREAIKLDITDYLLKPAADHDIGELLDKIRDKLMHNQTLLEREVAKQIMDASDDSDPIRAEWESIAKELFYHGNYLLVYALSLQGDIPAGIHDTFISMLQEGEKFTLLPSAAGNEDILLFGMHTWSNVRQAEWTQAIKSRAKAEDGVTVAMALSTRGLQPVPALLADCKRLVRAKSRFEGSSFWIDEGFTEDIKPLLEPLQPALLRLNQFITKQQKQLFAKELDIFFAEESKKSFPITRRGWELILLHASHTLHSLAKDSFTSTFDLKQAMELEVSDEVWRARKRIDLHTQVKEIWCSYFFRSEHDQETQRDWAKEAKQYMHAQFLENISLTSIADVFQLHPAYLNRVFKRTFQISIPDYLIKLRMDEACRFMREHPFVLIKDIAEHVGYLDPYYFSKVFKQHTGSSPTDYKNQNG
ncbi:response regulator transcription factor [Paenibacillus sp. LPE1-1-1.1]|uniref:response regulator transcription factor n=1 Tax=Paenibacillus sp. LPE1-1-1.1 TaxID=3135230 RepID=UPI0034433443